MNNIIQRAKKLFENRYHKEPWLSMIGDPMQEYWVETDNFAEVCGDFVSEDDTLLAAAAPAFAQALAEEEYQYGVRYIGINHGGTHIEWVEPTDDPELDKDILQRIVISGEKWGQFPKVVRRRVSPVEEVNE